MDSKFKLLIQINSKSIEERARLVQELTNILFQLTQALFARKHIVQHHEREVENKIYRFGLVSNSIIKLSKSVSITVHDKSYKVLDLFSVYTLMRQQIESFIILFYLIFDSVSAQEKSLRYDVYKIHGLVKQSGMDVKSDSAKKMKAEILKELEEVRAHLKENPYYAKASQKVKHSYGYPKYPKIIKLYDLFAKANVKALRLHELWGLYSNYAHGEYISDRQFNFYKGNNRALISSLLTVLYQLGYLTARLINFMKNEFPASLTEYKQLREDQKLLINVWMELIEKRIEATSNTL